MKLFHELIAIGIRQMPLLIATIVGLCILVSVLEVGTLGLLPPLFALLSGAPADTFQWPISRIIASFSGQSRTDVVLFFAAALSGLMFARFAVVATNYWLIGEVDRRIVAHLREGCLNTLFFAPQSFLDNYDNARIIQHLNEQSLRSGEAARAALKGITPLFSFMFGVALLGLLSWQLTLASLGVLAILAAVIAFIPRAIGEQARRYVQAVYNYNVKVMDLVGGIKTVRSFGSYNKERVQTTMLLEQQMDAQKRKVFLSGITMPVFETLGFLTLCVILVLSVVLVSGKTWMAVLAPFIIILARSIPQMSVVNNLRSLASLNSADYEAVKAFIRVTEPQAGTRKLLTDSFRALVFEHVTFTYPERDRLVLRDICLTVHKGDWVLITGPSGSGKSTLLSLISGLYEPTGGRVFVNGRDLREVDLQSWLWRIGVVEQIPFIFNGSIRDNIAYGDQAIEDEFVWSALGAAGLDEFMHHLQNGLRTELGDGGVQLSGGQRQRLAVARALCHRPDILVLDEPTSALDRDTEMQVLQSLRGLFPEITVIAVSHSELMSRMFDRAYRLDGGVLVEQGSVSQGYPRHRQADSG